FGAIFLALEAYEVLTNADVTLSFWMFVLLGLLPGAIFFLLDGYQMTGFLRREVEIRDPSNDTRISVTFGDLFAQQGWKAISVNDFFDSIVDDDIVAEKSLHGHVLNTYWGDDRSDWEKQVEKSLRTHPGHKETRPKGNRLRYPIGTTARACVQGHKFLFVALGETNTANNVSSADAGMVIKAVRGLVAEARAACSMEPLVIPLMGSRFARVGIRSSVLVDLIITGVLEESREGHVTDEIRIVLPVSTAHEINLKNYVRNWGRRP
ncbi:MAG: macro domain-containing protein, partial [Pseudomonadota bacterium]